MPLFNKYLKRREGQTLYDAGSRARALYDYDEDAPVQRAAVQRATVQQRESNPLPDRFIKQQIYDTLISSSKEEIRKLRELKREKTYVEAEMLVFMEARDKARAKAIAAKGLFMDKVVVDTAEGISSGRYRERDRRAIEEKGAALAQERWLAFRAEDKALVEKKTQELFEVILKNREQTEPKSDVARPSGKVTCDTPYVEGTLVPQPIDFAEEGQYGVIPALITVSDRALGLGLGEEDEDVQRTPRLGEILVAGRGEQEGYGELGEELVSAADRVREADISRKKAVMVRSLGANAKYTIRGDRAAKEAGIKKLVERLQIDGGELDSLRRYNTYGQKFAWRLLYDMLAPQLRKLLLAGGGTTGMGWDPDDLVSETFLMVSGQAQNGKPAIWKYDPSRVRRGFLSYLKIIADGLKKNATRKQSPELLTNRRYLVVGEKETPVYQAIPVMQGKRLSAKSALVYFDEIAAGRKITAQDAVDEALQRPLFIQVVVVDDDGVEREELRQLSGKDLDQNRPTRSKLRFVTEYLMEETVPEKFEVFKRSASGALVSGGEYQPAPVRKPVRLRAEQGFSELGSKVEGEENDEEFFTGDEWQTGDEDRDIAQQASDYELILEKARLNAERLGLVGDEEGNIGSISGSQAEDLSGAPYEVKRHFVLGVLGALKDGANPDLAIGAEMFLANVMTKPKKSVRDLQAERNPDGTYKYVGPTGEPLSEGTVKNRINAAKVCVAEAVAAAMDLDVETILARMAKAGEEGRDKKKATPSVTQRESNPYLPAYIAHRLNADSYRRGNPGDELNERASDYIDAILGY